MVRADGLGADKHLSISCPLKGDCEDQMVDSVFKGP